MGSISRGRDLYSKAYFYFYKIYESLFVSLAKCVTGETDEIGLDRRGIGNIGHLRFDDLIKESTRQKRNPAVIDKTSLRSSSVLFHLNIVFSLFIILILSKVKLIIQFFFSIYIELYSYTMRTADVVTQRMIETERIRNGANLFSTMKNMISYN